ncbi:hypothetical protein V2S66_30170 [Streptomyces sp. V4-01]|uniref:Uncharacterized protein n=1 Tax=Actinacidiphila polyblastidii TaxID=3110430 RepID=A0ABU7PLW3_9ACTN|nr:hypothetical protein [Streptomyces sp. V4-01]
MSETYDLPGVEPAAPSATSSVTSTGTAAVPEPESAPEPEPLGVVLGETGNAEVDTAVERLRDADGLPVHAHTEVYEDVHLGLRDALTALDENRG